MRKACQCHVLVIGHILAGGCLSCAGQAQGNRAIGTPRPPILPQVWVTCGRIINLPTKVGAGTAVFNRRRLMGNDQALQPRRGASGASAGWAHFGFTPALPLATDTKHIARRTH